MNWLNRFLSNAPRDLDSPSHSTGFYDVEGKPVPISADQQNVRAARELVHAAAVRTAAAFGIPSNWMSYEVVTISDDEKAYFQLQVSLRIWDEQLWAQSSAFEQQALKRIREDDVNVARAVRAVLWRILPDAGCPHDELSGNDSWKPEKVKARAVAYDRLRNELAAISTSFPSVITGLDASATLPSPSSGFSETMPVHSPDFLNTESAATGFANTRPFKLSEDLPAVDQGQR
ncbi:hypothetical protein [Variovorax sp. PCZ-1]|uniref:hypothetical protein n=1 Tax=Variovorax sp. PCZ-1 TaxID=2835533 RepID=UPI001BCB9EB4|nr:hypothetical protein [Variovorax sp. PCZ-1]MBS7809079.1 hypothetical protein [Variovorax sp. PCZ-1]